MNIDKGMCLTCKGGRNLCGLGYCPLMEKMKLQIPIQERASKEEIFGPTPPNVFVGRANYPNVSWGPMVSLEEKNSELYDTPSQWYGASYQDIIRFRSSLIRSEQRANVYERTRLLEKAQEVVLSIAPVDVEMQFARKPTYTVSFSQINQPMGPSAPLKDFRVCENPEIPKRVDQLANEKIKAVEAARELSEHGFDIYYLTKLLSAGVLGINKKLVPTRWSITATDDMLSKQQMSRIREYPQLSNFLVYSNEYLYNHFEILLLPGAWEFEQFESWAPGTLWTQGARGMSTVQEYEPFAGRTAYAQKEGGGYYAGRYGVTEALDNLRKQARAVVFREIHEGYVLPVGVWEVRENVRNAFKNQPKKFSSLKDALSDISTRLRVPISTYLKMSSILQQRKLVDF
ncbi:MAG: Nre family DNA repair protein [Candidatus Micrarchaeota archaeon]